MHANGVASNSRFISTDVPEGSILGPLLFTNFVNDLPKSSTFFSTRLYADIHLKLLLEVILTVYCAKLTIIYQLPTNGCAVIN